MYKYEKCSKYLCSKQRYNYHVNKKFPCAILSKRTISLI